MNRHNNYEQLLQHANEDLEKFGMKLELRMEEEDDTYGVYVHDKNGRTTCFAEGFFEDELGELVNDAWAHTLAKARAKKYKLRVILMDNETGDIFEEGGLRKVRREDERGNTSYEIVEKEFKTEEARQAYIDALYDITLGCYTTYAVL